MLDPVAIAYLAVFLAFVGVTFFMLCDRYASENVARIEMDRRVRQYERRRAVARRNRR